MDWTLPGPPVSQEERQSVAAIAETEKQIRNFFTSQCQSYRPGTAQVVASAIRSYLRFRAATCGSNRVSAGGGPIGCVLATGGFARVIGGGRTRLAPGCVRRNAASTSARLRDRAIVRWLVDLGLRSCEIAALPLDDRTTSIGRTAPGWSVRKNLNAVMCCPAFHYWTRHCRVSAKSAAHHRKPCGFCPSPYRCNCAIEKGSQKLPFLGECLSFARRSA